MANLDWVDFGLSDFAGLFFKLGRYYIGSKGNSVSLHTKSITGSVECYDLRLTQSSRICFAC